MEYLSLNKVDTINEVEVERILATGDLRRRFFDLGIIEGTKIKVLFTSAIGNLRAYSIRGAVLAIRDIEAELIIVK